MNAKSYIYIASHAVVRIFCFVGLVSGMLVSTGRGAEADLEIVSVACEAQRHLNGSKLAFEVAVSNNGPDWCIDWTLHVHASADPIITAADPLLGSIELNWIQPFTMDTISPGSFTPAIIAEGNYYVGVRSEYADDPVALNNTGFDPITVRFCDRWDLELLAVDAEDGPLYKNHPFQVTIQLKNNGPGDVELETIKFYASHDPDIDIYNDILIGEANCPAIPPGEEYEFVGTACLPWMRLSGDYFIGADVGASEEVADLVPVSFSYPTDLVLEEIMAPDVDVVAGHDLLAGFRIRNQGSLDALQHRLSLYLSSDTLITDDDIDLGGYSTWHDLPAGATTSDVCIVTVPVDTPPGEYYLGGIVDLSHEEQTPADNAAYDASPRISVLAAPELELAAATTTDVPAAVGANLELDCEVVHVAGGAIPEYTVAVSLAEWSLWLDYTLAYSCIRGPVSSGQVDAVSLSVPVPGWVTYADYVVKVAIEYDRTGGDGSDSITIFPVRFFADDVYEGDSIQNDIIQYSYLWPSNSLGGALSNIDGPGLQYDDDWYGCYVDTALGGQLVVTCSYEQAEGVLDLSVYEYSEAGQTGYVVGASTESVVLNVPSNGWYFLKVSGSNMGIEYDLSYTNRPPLPFAPINVVAQTGSASGTIDLSWDSCAGATGYTIHYDDGYIYPPFDPADDGTPASGSDVGGVTNGVITHLSPEQFYHLAVKAYNANGESEFSAMVSARAGAAIAKDDAYEKNNSLDTAWYPGSPWPGIPLSDFSGAGIQADDDWYRLVLQPVGYEHLTVTAAFVRVEGDIMLDLYDDQTNLVATSVGAHDMEFIDVVCPAPGNYFLKVWGEHAGNSYNLIWNNVWVDSKPVIDVSPGSFDFGRLEAGQSSNTVFTIRNDGGGTLTGNASVSSPLSILSSTAFSLVHSQTQDFLVRFSAGSIGVFTNDLVFSGAYGTACQVTGRSGAPRPHIKNFKILSPKEAVIEWDGVKGAEYYILTNMDLASDSWSILQYGIPGAVFNSETSKVFSATNMFYRLGVD
ncbi:hypothetical protein [Pontiella sulfatireligans]|uniref:Fibronectin type-III domain-containing protein n=1 Tax=Pontiella sulfatireligans TaxID=2750658 RepID=A0A6C2UPR4_9BACT|nr:hypothetical protein [Pontiella sulfatireligans]VGO21307.1 hypothetical protein SCARR_03379 [Pontiella sulfatireligans]